MKNYTLAGSNRWALAVAVLLVVPGTALSVAFGAIGVVILLVFLVDSVAGAHLRPAKRLHPLVQVVVALCAAAAIGGIVALAAWIV